MNTTDQFLWILLYIMVGLGVLVVLTAGYALSRDKDDVQKNLTLIHSDKPDQAAKAFMRLLFSGVILFCYISNSTKTFNPAENLRQFSNVLANRQVLDLAKDISKISNER